MVLVAGLVLYLSLSSLHSSHHHPQTMMRQATHRSPSVPAPPPITADAVRDEMAQRTSGLNDRAKAGVALTDEELDGIQCSLLNVCPKEEALDCDALTKLLLDVAHLSHKDWAVTGTNSQKLASILLPDGLTEGRKQMVERILKEGNWDGAFSHASVKDPLQKPWIVLVTGVNGIRKTTSMYQPWFKDVLAEAISGPSSTTTTVGDSNPTVDAATIILPDGTNSFFRQLDHMIATLCNEEFSKLYTYSRDLTAAVANTDGSRPPPSRDVIRLYSDMKAAIFTRYRTLSELLGVALLRAAQAENLNCMLETSGRDVAMFHYVDRFFPAHQYNKLALRFTINNLAFAENSVDSRMVDEIEGGIKALPDAFDVIEANKGGPYGSAVLAGVQSDSDKVWAADVMSGNVGADWYKATIAIEGHDTKPWVARAVRPSGGHGSAFDFVPRRH